MDSDEVRREWEERSGEYSPAYYAYYGPDETSDRLLDHLERAVDRDAAVLELGCSSGRHLAHLREHGYENLHGIEINEDAFDVMEEAYPGLAADGTFYCDAIENVVREFDDDRFDAVYSVETLQHLHPDDSWVFDALTRIAADLLVTVEIEECDDRSADDSSAGDSSTADSSADGSIDDDSGSAEAGVNFVKDDIPLYYRDWNRVFTDRGLTEIDSTTIGQDTVRAFRFGRE